MKNKIAEYLHHANKTKQRNTRKNRHTNRNTQSGSSLAHHLLHLLRNSCEERPLDSLISQLLILSVHSLGVCLFHRALKLEGGMLHVHANVRAGEQRQWANEMIEKLRALASELPEQEKRQFEVWVGVRDVHRILLWVFACRECFALMWARSFSCWA